MTTTTNPNLFELASRAFSGTSFDPERRAKTALAGCDEQIAQFRQYVDKLATTAEQQAIADKEATTFAERYRRAFEAWLSTRSRCMSTMITGPANFPVARNNKAWQAERNANDRMSELVAKAERAACRRINAVRTLEQRTHDAIHGGDDIRSGDKDAVHMLTAKIAHLEAHRDEMKEVNKKLRKAKIKSKGNDHLESDLKAAGVPAHHIPELLSLAKCWGSASFPPYSLTNLGANIRRLKQRLAHEQHLQAQESRTHTTQDSDIRIEECPSENRVRIYFPDKPDADTRSCLKRNGFRWSPRNKAWQAYLKQWNVATAKEIAGVK